MRQHAFLPSGDQIQNFLDETLEPACIVCSYPVSDGRHYRDDAGPARRLFNVDGDEDGWWSTLDECVSRWLDDAYGGGDAPETLVVDEWSVHANSHFIPDFLDWLRLEEIEEVTEGWVEQFDRALASDEVRAKASELEALIASKISYVMAKDVVNQWRITFDRDARPITWTVRPCQ